MVLSKPRTGKITRRTKMAEHNKSSKSMDIATKGKKMPDTSARPIIVTHRPIMQDPMVTKDETPVSPTPQLARSGKALTPDTTETDGQENEPEQTTNAEEPEQPQETQPEETPKPDEPAQEVAKDGVKDEPAERQSAEPDTKKDESKPVASQTEDKDTQAAVVDAVVDQADVSSKKLKDDEARAEQETRDKLAKLIADKKYFVPIGQVKKRKNRRNLVVLTLVVLVAVAVVYLLADAGIIDTGIKLPFRVIGS